MDDFNINYGKLGRVENGDMIATGSDAEYAAVFHMAKVPNFEGTDFTEVPHLRLQAPGNTRTIYDQPVRFDSHPQRPSDPERFPREWAAFKGGEETKDGVSLYAWDQVTPGDARRFEIMGIKTVEQLARVSDGNLQELGMGGRLVRERARAFVAGVDNTNEAELQAKVAKLTDIVEALLAERAESEPAKRGPGRPKKELADAE